jgi:Flp pilus assembly protein TadB
MTAMNENAQGIVMFLAVGAAVFAVTWLVSSPLWLAVVLAGVAAGLATFAVGRATRRT